MKNNNRMPQMDERILIKIVKVLFAIFNICIYLGLLYHLICNISAYMIKFNVHDKIMKVIVVVSSFTFITMIFFVLIVAIIDLFDGQS